MKSFKLDRFDLVACVLLLLSYVAVWKAPFGTPKLGDGIFHAEAKMLARAIRGVEPWQDFGMSRAPAPVLYYALPYLVVTPGSSDDRYWRAGFVWTIGWMLLSLLLIRRIGDRMGGPLTGKLTALLMLLTPFWAYYSYGVLAESPAFIGTVVLVYGWLRWRESDESHLPRKKAAWLVCAGFALLALSRPNTLLLLGFALLAALALFRSGSPRNVRMAKFTLSVVTVVGLAVGAATVVVRSLPRYQQADFLIWVTFNGAFQYRTEPWNWNYWDKMRRKGTPDYDTWDRTYKELARQARQTGKSSSEALKKWLVDDMVGHPLLWIRMAAVRELALHSAFVNSQKPEAFRLGPINGKVVYAVFHIFVNLVNFLLVAGALRFLYTRRRDWAAWWPLWGPWISLVLFHTVVYAEPRYFFPVRPCVTAMAAAAFTPAVSRALSWFQNRVLSAPSASAGVLGKPA